MAKTTPRTTGKQRRNTPTRRQSTRDASRSRSKRAAKNPQKLVDAKKQSRADALAAVIEERESVSESARSAERIHTNRFEKPDMGHTSSSSHSRVLRVAVSILGIVVIAVGVFAIGIYAFKWKNTVVQTVVRVVPYPAAVVNAQLVSVRDYWNAVQRVETLVEKQEQQVSQPDLLEFPGDEQVASSTLDRMIEGELIEQLSAAHGAVPNASTLDRMLSELTEQLGGSDALEATLDETYGWTVEQFQELVLVPYVNRITLAESVVADAQKAENQDARARAEEVRDLATADPERFAELAREHSDDTVTAPGGGDLGYIRPNDLLGLDSLVDALRILSVGEISEVVVTRLGYHVVLLEERIEDPETGDVRLRIRHILFRGVDFESWLDEQRSAARIYTFL